MLTRTGTYHSPKASQYMQQLCKHFAHKVEASADATSGRVAFPFGPAEMTADDGSFTVVVSAEDAAGLDRAAEVIDAHLERFAFREEIKRVTWAV